MTGLPDPRFELRKIAEREWLILDHRYDASDPHRSVGRIYQVDEYEVEVMWMKDIAAATRYMSPVEVLEEVQRLHDRARSNRPIVIPHLPPLLAT